jgi:thymidylate kinase
MVEAALARASAVCDRYLPSALAVVVAEGLIDPQGFDRQGFDRLRGAVEPLVLRPDLTLLLVADHATAAARSTRRARSPRETTAVHRRALDSEPYFRSWEAALRRHATRLGPIAEIDTTALSAREAVEAALAAVAGPHGA